MKKGIIMEMDESFLTLLTPEGEFLRSRNENKPYQIGEEIYFYPIQSTAVSEKKRHKNFLKINPIWAVSALAVLILVIGSFIPIYQDNKAYAYMSIDVRPSIELGVNKKMQVVEIAGFNSDGKKVVSEVSDWKKKDVSDVTKTILKVMDKQGYLKSNDPVLISTVHAEVPEEKAESLLKDNIEEIKQAVKKQQLSLTVYNGTEKEREKAKQLGITTGKLHENKLESNENKEIHETGIYLQKENDVVNRSNQSHVQPPGQIKKQQGKQPVQKSAPPHNQGIVPDKNNKNIENHGNAAKTPPGQKKKINEQVKNGTENASQKEKTNQKQSAKQEKSKSNPNKAKDLQGTSKQKLKGNQKSN